MRNEHILDILDDKTFGELNAAEKRIIENHTAVCSECLRAYRAAQFGAALLKTSVTQNFEPSTFFQARVMANLREKQAVKKPFAAIMRLWRASETLVAIMLTAVICLIALTALTPEFNKVSSANVAEFDNYSSEMVILNENSPLKEPTNEQVLQIVYDSDSGK